MKRLLFQLAVASTWLACLGLRPAAAQESHDAKENATAYTALRVVGKTLGADAINRVVEVTGRDGKPQPVSWRIVLKEGEGTREVDVVNGKIEAQRPLSRSVAATPIKLPDLNLDSSGAFEATDTQARKTQVRFDSVNYTLRTSDKTGKPLWTLELFSQEGTAAGTMRIAANNGAIASVEGHIAPETATPPKKPVAEEKPTPRPTPAVAVAEPRPTPRREPRTVTTTTTVVQASSAQTNAPVAVVDLPDADPAGPAAPPPPDDGGGFFTRTGRTLDHTSHTVTRSIDNAGHTVNDNLRRTGAKLQRFFTGRSDHDVAPRPVPPPTVNQPD